LDESRAELLSIVNEINLHSVAKYTLREEIDPSQPENSPMPNTRLTVYIMADGKLVSSKWIAYTFLLAEARIILNVIKIEEKAG
jgi:hypothetical protein